MLVSVTFAYVAGGSAGREISKEEEVMPPIPSSISVVVAGRLEQLYLNTQT